ncbi:beta-lactamase family protein, partial [Ferruginibacter sp. HRS2-29]
PCGMTNTDFGHKHVPLAAGGGQGTANDYIRFLQMILAKGLYNGKRVLQASSVELMQQNYTAGKKIISTPAEADNWGYGLGEWMLEESPGEKVANAVTSPGLFGSFPWVDNKRQYVGILFCFNLKNKGRAEKYTTLKKLVDEQLDK